MRTTQFTLLLLLLGVANASAQLAVSIAPVKFAGQKAVVPLTLSNGLPQQIESARAVCFLLDEQGKMVGQSTKWIIGGSQTNGLPAGATNRFYFVITSPTGFGTTNLSTRLSFTRLVLQGGKPANPTRDISIVTVDAAR
jgi:hypothetical protein